MPGATRIPTVTFRSLLLPPIRISSRAIQTLYRPSCTPSSVHAARAPQCLAQRRSLHLYMTARSKTVLGQHKILTFSEYTMPELSESEHRVNLVKSETDRTIIAEGLSFQELHDRFVKDGQLLYSADTPKKAFNDDYEKIKEADYATEYNNYALKEPHQIRISKKNTPAVGQLGPLKIMIFNLSSPIDYTKTVLDRAYQFLELGYSVEFRIRIKGKKLTKQERLLPGDAAAWPWMHNHFPHLRPDIICKSMPTGTQYLIRPWSDGRIVQWVLMKPWKNMPEMKLNERLASVKESVTKSIKQGKQSQLPQMLRQRLHDEGNAEYSPFTGLPRAQAREKFSKGGTIKMSGEEKKRIAQDAESTRFMVPDHVEGLEKAAPRGESRSAQELTGDLQQVGDMRRAAEFSKALEEGRSLLQRPIDKNAFFMGQKQDTKERRPYDSRPKHRWEGRGKVNKP